MADVYDPWKEAVKNVHKACLETIEALMDYNPEPGTPEFNLLKGLAEAVDEYERAEFGEEPGASRIHPPKG